MQMKKYLLFYLILLISVDKLQATLILKSESDLPVSLYVIKADGYMLQGFTGGMPPKGWSSSPISFGSGPTRLSKIRIQDEKNNLLDEIDISKYTDTDFTANGPLIVTIIHDIYTSRTAAPNHSNYWLSRNYFSKQENEDRRVAEEKAAKERAAWAQQVGISMPSGPLPAQ